MIELNNLFQKDWGTTASATRGTIELKRLFQKGRGKTASAAKIQSPNPTRLPSPGLLIQSFFYGDGPYIFHTFFNVKSMKYKRVRRDILSMQNPPPLSRRWLVGHEWTRRHQVNTPTIWFGLGLLGNHSPFHGGQGGRNSANFCWVWHVSQLIPNIPLVDRPVTVKFVGTTCSVSFSESFLFSRV